MFIGLETLNVDPVDVGFPRGGQELGILRRLAAIGVQYGDRFQVEGTAVMIGLGLAISAKHVLDEHMAAYIRAKGSTLRGYASRGPSRSLDPYQIQRSPEGGGDLALFVLKLGSDVPPGGRFTILP